MWSKSHSIVTKLATKEQMWTLLSDVNNWHTWDMDIEYAKMDGKFEQGNTFLLKPKGGPKVNIELIEVVKPYKFTDMTKFPLAKMYGEHVFEDTADGLKLTTTMKVEGILGFLWRKLVAQGIVNSLPVEMEAQVKLASQL